jgi:hypothetical protein
LFDAGKTVAADESLVVNLDGRCLETSTSTTMTTALVRPNILYAWKGPSLFIANTHGDCGDDQTLSGYYFREARFLRTLRLEIDGDPPWLCEAAVTGPDSLSFNYVYPEIAEYGGGGSGQAGDDTPSSARGIPQRALAIRALYLVTLDRLDIRLNITNHSRRRVACELAWRVGTDFADIQEAQDGNLAQHATVQAAPAAGA